MSEEEEQIKRILAILHHIKEHGVIGAEEVKNISGNCYQDDLHELSERGITINLITDGSEVNHERIKPAIMYYRKKLSIIMRPKTAIDSSKLHICNNITETSMRNDLQPLNKSQKLREWGSFVCEVLMVVLTLLALRSC